MFQISIKGLWISTADFYPVSLLSLLPLAHFLAWSSPLSPLVYPSSTWTDSSITSKPFAPSLFITLMMEAVCISETLVYSKTTWRYTPEGCHLHIRHCENLKSHITYCSSHTGYKDNFTINIQFVSDDLHFVLLYPSMYFPPLPFSCHSLCDLQFRHMASMNVENPASRDHLVIAFQCHVPCLCMAYLY
jgi:hypothetical protein